MSRYRQLQKKLRKGQARPNVDDLSSSDASARGGAVRSCCPCRVGWQHYEANRDVVEAMCKDDDPVVRFNALHVRSDAVQAEALSERNAQRRAAERARIEREKVKRATRARKQSARLKGR